MRYTFTVPPTHHVGSYSGQCSTSYGETYRQNALSDYNSVRAHDGLPPLARMPAGTKYRPIYEYVIQGRYPAFGSHEWEDENSEDTRADGLRSLKEYRANGPGFYRMIRRAAD